MKFKIIKHTIILSLIALSACQNNEKQAVVEQEILENGRMIRAAFAAGDLAQIESLHHPDVVKALGYNDVKVGRDAVINGIRETLENYNLEFVENNIENIYIQDDVAIEQTKFSIQGTPKKEGSSFLFKGRTMVTYVRDKNSPSGWVTIREIIQPATE
ncbi:MAG: nuclear transport factor 2 family protein [Bacteroidota bacterium]